MAAYASLLALARTLHQILTLDRYPNPLDKEKIVSLFQKVDSSLNFLQDYSDQHGGTVDLVGNEMKSAAYEAQDFMDSYLFLVSRNDFDSSSSEPFSVASVDQGLNLALEKIDFFWEEAMKNKKIPLSSMADSSPVDHSSAIKIPVKKMVVGFDDDIDAINEQLYEDSAKLQIIPIVGMGGIGKTTLARRVYQSAILSRHFDICGWITVSAEYRKRQVLSGLLHYLVEADDVQCHQSDAQLATLVYQGFMGRRYLVVIDDVWDTKAWDDLKRVFPEDGIGSRILITTRLSDVAIYARSSSSQLHLMKFLNEDRSWELLQERIFGLESCPPELVEIGKKIAYSCGGLPLTIVVVAGILISTSNIMRQELWENVSKNISSTEPTIESHCSKILCLSCDRLPLHLKPCFLYMTAFPEDSEIEVSKLIKMWVAEGFLKPSDRSKCMEDVGGGYLEDLVNRSLILVRKKGPDGKLETVGVHDLLREICATKAEEEGFLHHVSSNRNVHKVDATQNPYRRISIHYTQALWEWRIQESSIHSVLLFSERNLGSTFFLSSRRLSILDAPEVTWPNLSDVISALFNLRYIAFALNDSSCPHGFPTSITKLPNLQTVIAHRTYFRRDYLLQIQCEIWETPKLRHLITDTPFRLPSPSSRGIVQESDIQTLETVVDFKFTEEIIKIFVNLKKLKVIFTMCLDNWDDYNLNNLFRLNNLEELKVSVDDLPNPSITWNHTFPISLKKLTLEGVPWHWDNNMTIIGSLPNLEVLQMMNIKVTGFSEHWTPMEDQFLRLKYFRSSLDHLVKWEVEKEHFPSLESLILRRAQIDEIPSGIGEIDSLQLIELQFCKESLVDSANLIQQQQHENGNLAFQVRVNNSDKHDFWF
ncbi:putative late blight resistance protein homolog R1C-3 [Henckelia pumila]|uniref:putative late blight resistance protein homolog R1C-3 n=1 Tax=Henckelia pumila TaxID=405737 RepID=UPI003C6DD5B8